MTGSKSQNTPHGCKFERLIQLPAGSYGDGMNRRSMKNMRKVSVLRTFLCADIFEV